MPINFKPLESKLTELFPGKSFVLIGGDLSPATKPAITHSDLMDTVGSFNLAIKSVNVHFFNYHWSDEKGLWGTIYMSYESHGGGSNGMQIMSVWCDPNGEWTFELSSKK